MSTEEQELPEEMAAFFDARAAGYDDHMRHNVYQSDALYSQFYEAVASPIYRTDEPLEVLSLGCGTGLEFEALFQRAPNALITGVDLSENMLEGLRTTYDGRMSQITLVADSFLSMDLGTERYDHIVSVMSMHHMLHDTKRKLYMKIRAALRPGGRYIEGDSVASAEIENQLLTEFHQEVASVPPADDGYYHIDVPFSLETQRTLLLEAGFKDFEVLWREDRPHGWNIAVYDVTR